MSHSVQMPALGESVTEGTVTRWLKKEGDRVAEDEPLLEVSTDKVDTEVPAPYAGVLERILVQEDETVAVGADLAIIGDGSGDSAASAPAATAPAPAAPAAAAPAAAPTAAPEPVAVAAPEPAAPAADGPVAGTTVTMPAMGESVTEGTVTRWLKAVGDTVAEDEPIVEIATDKVDAEVPSPVAGTLLQILAAEDATVEVGSPIAVVGSAAAAPAAAPSTPAPAAPAAAAPAVASPAPAAPAPSPVPAPAAAPEPSPAPTPAAATPPAAPAAARTGYVTPVVRKLAADRGVDLAAVVGTGVGGRIRREDVLAAASKPASATPPAPSIPAPAAPTPAAAPAPSVPAATVPSAGSARPASASPSTSSLVGTVQPAPRIRQAIARSMMHAVTTSAQTTTIIEVDATRVAALRDRAVAGGNAAVPPTLAAFFVKAAIEAAKTNPVINASLSDDLTQITYHAAVHLGVAVDTPRGQIAPVIHGADDLTVTALARKIGELTDRAVRGQLGPDELSGATFTVSDAGSPGALIDTPIVVPPQAAMMALGAVAKRPVVITDGDGNDVIAVRSIATVALSYDQRFVDGPDAARFLSSVKRRIEDGDFDPDLGF